MRPEGVRLRPRRCLRLLDVSRLLRGEHSAGRVTGEYGSLYALHARGNSIKRDGRLQGDDVDRLARIFLFLCAILFGPCLAFVGLTSVLKPHGNEFDVSVSTGKHKF